MNGEVPESVDVQYEVDKAKSNINLSGDALEWYSISMTGVELSANGIIITNLARKTAIKQLSCKLSNKEVREWYLSQESRIPSLLDERATLKEQANQAFNFRNQFRTEARSIMQDRVEAEFLDYADPNFSWDEIVNIYKGRGYEGDALWNKIIEGSQKSRKTANEASGVYK